jgi:hypothetical protein
MEDRAKPKCSPETLYRLTLLMANAIAHKGESARAEVLAKIAEELDLDRTQLEVLGSVKVGAGGDRAIVVIDERDA